VKPCRVAELRERELPPRKNVSQNPSKKGCFEDQNAYKNADTIFENGDIAINITECLPRLL